MIASEEKLGIVVGDNSDPMQHVREDEPTHACFHADGTTSVVYPEGHDPETLVELPPDYDEQTHEIVHATRAFVPRKEPLTRRDPAAEIAALERDLAELRARLVSLLPPDGEGAR